MKVKPNGRQHDLKVWRAQYAALLDGSKTFEFRKEDKGRVFEIGDVLFLREYNESAGRHVNYQCRVIKRIVTYVLRHGFDMPAGMVVLGLQKMTTRRS